MPIRSAALHTSVTLLAACWLNGCASAPPRPPAQTTPAPTSTPVAAPATVKPVPTTAQAARTTATALPQEQHLGARAFDDLKRTTPTVVPGATAEPPAPPASTEYEQLKRSLRHADHWAATALVQRVGLRLLRATGAADPEPETVLFDHDAALAFCLPGGKIGVHMGLFAELEDEDELAAAIAHVIAHTRTQHGAARVRAGLRPLGYGSAEDALRRDPVAGHRLLRSAYGLGTLDNGAAPYTREQELEADRLALSLMVRAGYDPAGAAEFWNRLQEKAGAPAPALARTHPYGRERRAQLERLLPQARREYAATHKR